MVRVTIDGVDHDFDADQSILDAAARVGVEIPAACHDPRVEPSGACRLCLVQVLGGQRPVAACTTHIVDGMTVETDTPELAALRRDLLGMLARSYPDAACDAQPEKPFHQLLRRHGVRGVGRATDAGLVDASHPYIRVDMNRCILCFRCVRICSELQGQSTWRVWERASATRIVPDSATTLRESSCVSCGACVDTCPTGAIEDREVLEVGTTQRWTRTVCPYCGVGCELEVGTRGERIVAARPVLDAPVSKGHLCVKGRYAHGFVHATDRVTHPMIRRDGRWEQVSWEEAVTHVAEELERVLRRHGPGSVGLLGSARATNEDNYLTQKFARRVVLGTNNVDCCARVCHAPSAAALGAMLGTGAATNSFDDIEQARTILVCGANATENHPIVGARIKQAKLRGANLVVIDPRVIELAEYADVHLRVRAGTNVALLNAMAHVILEEDLVDDGFLARRVDGLDEFRDLVSAYTPESVASACGVDPDDIRRAARLYVGETPAMSFHGLGMTEHRHGTEMVTSLVNLALLTGNLGKAGAGVNPLRGQNNVQGAAQMGCEPDRLTGFVPLDEGRAAFAAIWEAPVPSAPGLDAVEMVQAAADRSLAALWVIGWDILFTNPDTEETRRALGNLDLVVVQDLFFNETARELGTVFLPACSTFERDGTFMNSERRIQRVRAALGPVGDSKPDWEVLCRVARAMGHRHQFPYSTAQEVWEEIRRGWPAVAGITYERLDAEHGLQWPCPDERHPGTQTLHTEAFPRLGPRATLARVPYLPPGDVTTPEFPWVLVTGRNLYQFNAGTMTMRTPNVVMRATDTLEISPDDARYLGIANGERVRVMSRYGTVELPAEITERIRPGELFTTFSDPANQVNRVTGPHQDARTHTPEYKVTAVHIAPERE